MAPSPSLRELAGIGVMYLRGERSVPWYVARGLTIGERCSLERPFELDRSHCWLITIGDDVTLAPGVYVIAHDASTKAATGHTRIAPVRIGSRVFIGARTTILPGVTIGDDVVVGAGSVVARDVPPATVVAGNPARPIQSIETYHAAVRDRFARLPTFGARFTVWGGITDDDKRRMSAELGPEGGFVP